VDVRAATAAYARLIGDAGLRRSLGEAGIAHTRRTFDWRVVIAAYRDL